MSAPLRIRHDDLSSEEAVPTCPAWLKGEAKAEWKRLLPQLIHNVGLSAIDRSILAAYCQSWADYSNACKELADHASHGYERVNNQWHPHPAAKMKEQAGAAMLKFAIQLGIGPAVRSKLKIKTIQKSAPSMRARER